MTNSTLPHHSATPTTHHAPTNQATTAEKTNTNTRKHAGGGGQTNGAYPINDAKYSKART
ncbi:hypothetical protein GCM10009621_12710 [Corynebacterium felinum]